MARSKWICESCGGMLAKGERYVLKVASYAAYDGLNVNLLDLARDAVTP